MRSWVIVRPLRLYLANEAAGGGFDVEDVLAELAGIVSRSRIAC